MAETELTINWVEEEEEKDETPDDEKEPNPELSLELHTHRNGGVTEFEKSNMVYLIAIPGTSQYKYETTISYGEISIYRKNDIFQKKEQFTFDGKTKNAFLKNTPSFTTSKWISGKYNQHVITGRQILLPNLAENEEEERYAIGTLEVEYSVLGDTLRIEPPLDMEEDEILVVNNYENELGTVDLTIKFLSDDEEDEEDEDIKYTPNLKIISTPEEGSSKFKKTDVVYLKTWPPKSLYPYIAKSSNGSVSLHGSDIPYREQNVIKFDSTNQVFSTDSPFKQGTQQAFWYSGGKGSQLLTVDNKVVVEETSDVDGYPRYNFGLCVYNYSVFCDRLAVTVPKEMEELQILVITDYGKHGVASVIIEYEDEEVIEEDPTILLRDVQISTLDVRSKTPVPGAVVTIEGVQGSGQYIDGNTVLFKDLTAGATYNVTITAPNYYPSGADYLANDSITIPLDEPEEEPEE